MTVPTRQCAFLILAFAVIRSCPSTFGTTHFGGMNVRGVAEVAEVAVAVAEVAEVAGVAGVAGVAEAGVAAVAEAVVAEAVVAGAVAGNRPLPGCSCRCP